MSFVGDGVVVVGVMIVALVLLFLHHHHNLLFHFRMEVLFICVCDGVVLAVMWRRIK